MTQAYLSYIKPHKPTSLFSSPPPSDYLSVGKDMLYLAQNPEELSNLMAKLTTKLADIKPVFEKFFSDDNPYIQRKDLENKLIKIAEKKKLINQNYYIIVGPKGAGKSAIVAKVFEDRKGVIKVNVNQNSSPDIIIRTILSKVNMNPVSGTYDIDQVKQKFDEVREKKRNGAPLTIILEVERGGASLETLGAVKTIAKSFAHSVTVIVILSEANAALEFGDDERQKFIWVDGMSEEEAMAYAKALQINLSDVELKKFFNQVGTLPLRISNLREDILDGIPLQNVIDDAIAIARGNLEEFAHTPILQKLKDKLVANIQSNSTDDGVNKGIFFDKKHEGVLLSSPRQVALAMKGSNAIYYHFPSREYRLSSQAHKKALLAFEFPSSS